jgi:hypothetical protein
MAGVLECVIKSKRQVVKPGQPFGNVNSKALELQTAKEILAEVFHARVSDVEDMIQRRLDEKSLPPAECQIGEKAPWPEMFWVEETSQARV